MVLCALLFLLQMQVLYSTNVLVFNIIGNNKKEVFTASRGAINFLKAMHRHGLECKNILSCHAHTQEEHMSDDVLQELNMYLNRRVEPFKSKRMVDTSVGQEAPQIEHVSEILWSLQESIERNKKDKSVVLMMTFSADTHPVFVAQFLQLLDHVAHHKKDSPKLMLLGKTEDLGSVSDWHDLMLIMFAPGERSVQHWAQHLLEVYLHHADRPAFALLKPRTAIMEAAIRTRRELKIGYFSAGDVCVELWIENKAANSRGLKNEHLGGLSSTNQDDQGHPAFCLDTSPSFLHINCAGGDTITRHACSTLHRPHAWKVGASVPVTDDRDGNLHEGYTVARFRNAKDKEKPLDYCWHTGCAHECVHGNIIRRLIGTCVMVFGMTVSRDPSYEDPVQSRIYISKKDVPYDPKNAPDSIPYHPPPKDTYPIVHKNITVMSGSGAHSHSMEMLMYYSMSRMYYADRHGYQHVHTLSNKYTPYLGRYFLNVSVYLALHLHLCV